MQMNDLTWKNFGKMT